MKKIKVYEINLFYGIGSTGKLVRDLYLYGKTNNIDMRVAARKSNINSDEYYCASSFLSKNFHSVMSRITGLQGYYSKYNTRKLVKDIIKFNPDIIHLHNLHGHFINLEFLFKFLKEYKKPIVWTLHDCWPFTGNCAYYVIENCNKWIKKCHNCPNIHKYPNSLFFDMSRKMYDDKRGYYGNGLNLNIITVSKWLENEVKKSFLKNYPVYTIYNYIDLNIFKPHRIKKNDKRVLLSIASSWSVEKGIYDLIDLSNRISDDFELILIGKMDKKYIKKINKSKVRLIGHVDSTEEMAFYYNYADILISLSKEETFGMTVAEATACGTPSITLKTSGIEEVVPKNLGVTIYKYDFNIIKNEISKLLNYDKQLLIKELRLYAEKNFNKYRQCSEYLELFEKIIK